MAGTPDISLADIASRSGRYPPEAYEFVNAALRFTAMRTHGSAVLDPRRKRHVSGEALCWGLRDLAQERWGLLARTVLAQWNITSTRDVGAIVFDLIECGLMERQESDTPEDFDDVFDFRKAFDESFRFESMHNDPQDEE
jgi:uncharacterized repeat protein (TIGR04138 family)